MKLKRILCFVIIFALTAVLFGCSGSKAPTEDEPEPYTPPEPQSVTVTDSDGRTVTTSQTNGDIISVGYESTSLLIALGAKGRITGVQMLDDSLPLLKKAYPEIENLPAVTDKNGKILTDKIKEQNPGLVILTGDYASYLEELESAGLTVAIVRFETVEQVKSSAELIGRLSNTDGTAEQLSAFYDSALTRLKTLTMTEDKKTVTVYNNDPILTELLSYLNCELSPQGKYTVAKAADNVNGAITAPSGIEPWDQPSVALVLGLYWYACKLFPNAVSVDEATQKAINFYADFYGVKLTAEDLGIKD